MFEFFSSTMSPREVGYVQEILNETTCANIYKKLIEHPNTLIKKIKNQSYNFLKINGVYPKKIYDTKQNFTLLFFLVSINDYNNNANILINCITKLLKSNKKNKFKDIIGYLKLELTKIYKVTNIDNQQSNKSIRDIIGENNDDLNVLKNLLEAIDNYKTYLKPIETSLTNEGSSDIKSISNVRDISHSKKIFGLNLFGKTKKCQNEKIEIKSLTNMNTKLLKEKTQLAEEKTQLLDQLKEYKNEYDPNNISNKLYGSTHFGSDHSISDHSGSEKFGGTRSSKKYRNKSKKSRKRTKKSRKNRSRKCK
jgi:hypothetical protein